MGVLRELHLGRSKALGFLDELASTEGKVISMYFPVGIAPARVETSLEKIFSQVAIPSGVVEKIANSKMGAAFFWSQPQMYLVLQSSSIIGINKFLRSFKLSPLILARFFMAV